MFTSNTVKIKGDAKVICAQIYQLAADIQDWPALLPHYRYMRIIERSETHKIADFGATRIFAFGGFSVPWPCSWQARQELFSLERRITYKHLRGFTRGMWVEWRLEPCGDHVRVTIDHELTYPLPILGPLFAKYIVGNLFVHQIAGKTLQCIKVKVESHV